MLAALDNATYRPLNATPLFKGHISADDVRP
jgi:hypothetical protein